MEAKEFRIGNTVRSVLTKKPVQIDLWALRVIEEGNYQNSYDTKTKVFRPIPLTEQVLIDCDAVDVTMKIRKKGVLKTYELHGVRFDLSNSGNIYHVYSGKLIPYLHRLQNLIFELKDVELEYKPNK